MLMFGGGPKEDSPAGRYQKPHRCEARLTLRERSTAKVTWTQLRLRRAPWTMSAFRADASMASPSWKSMARTDLLSRRVLKSPFGSFNWAPFGNVSLTAFLRLSPMQTMPSWDQTG